MYPDPRNKKDDTRFLSQKTGLGNLVFGWQFFSTIIFFLLFIYIFNWRIIALQYFVVFCHTSTRISHSYIHVPFPPKSPSHPIYPSSLSPCLSSLSHKTNSHWLSILHFVRSVSMLLSPYISPSPSFPHPGVLRSFLYVCYSMAALNINSSIPYF